MLNMTLGSDFLIFLFVINFIISVLSSNELTSANSKFDNFGAVLLLKADHVVLWSSEI